MTNSQSPNYYCHFLNSIYFTHILNNSHVVPPKPYKEGLSLPQVSPFFKGSVQNLEELLLKFLLISGGFKSFYYL